MNIWHGLGRVVTTPIVEEAHSGKKVCRFKLVTSNGKDRPSTKHYIVIWGKHPGDAHPENVVQHVRQGDIVQITGRISENTWTTKGINPEVRSRMEIIASSIEFVRTDRQGNHSNQETERVSRESLEDSNEPSNAVS